jgi:hypothetical protein
MAPGLCDLDILNLTRRLNVAEIGTIPSSFSLVHCSRVPLCFPLFPNDLGEK